MRLNSPHLAGAIVLAGGQSRRMGRDKALLQLQGEALLTRTCRMALAVSKPAIAITARSDYQSLLPQGCELLLEADPQGPLGAFAQALERIASQIVPRNDAWVLLLACDLPLLTVEDLVGAIAHLANLAPHTDAYLPPSVSGAQSSNGQATKQIDWEPLCGFYRLRCLTALQATLNQGTTSFQDWLTELKVAPLTHWPPEHLLNCNCPQDWVRVQEVVGDLRDR